MANALVGTRRIFPTALDLHLGVGVVGRHVGERAGRARRAAVKLSTRETESAEDGKLPIELVPEERKRRDLRVALQGFERLPPCRHRLLVTRVRAPAWCGRCWARVGVHELREHLQRDCAV